MVMMFQIACGGLRWKYVLARLGTPLATAEALRLFYISAFFNTFFFQAEDGIRDRTVTGVQTCALPIYLAGADPRHALLAAAAPRDRAGHGLPARRARSDPLADVPAGRGLHGGRARHLRRLEGRARPLPPPLLRARDRRALPAELLPLHRAERRGRHRLHGVRGRGPRARPGLPRLPPPRLDRRIVAGRLAAVEPHPEADRVQVCRVEVGRPAPLVAVSGAPGLAAGQMVPVALPGARLPDGGEAQAVRIRGVESAGVLCSEAELALGEDASQVLVLADDTAPGTPPSPLWVRLRLRRAGMRALNAVVDATNYVMLERGQPLHAFDLERLAERRIVVRRGASGERLTTLDGVERALEPDDLVIADGRGPVALAGVMGGEASEVTPATRVLLLESAFFAPASVRRASRRLALPSQAAYRFERRVDPAMVPEALDAVAALIARTAGGRVAPGIVEDAPGTKALAPPTIRLRPRRVVALLGTRVARGEIARSLRALGAACRTQRDALLVTPPSFRGDLRLEEDLIEEVARVGGGYDRIPVALPEVPLAAGEDTPGRRLAARVRQALVAAGLAEMVTLAFTDAETNRRLPGFVGRALAPLAVKNPLSSETGELRRSPLAGLVRALRLNRALGATFVGAFELGKGYGLDAGGARQEPRAVALLLTGAWPPRGVERTGPPVDS